MKFEKVKFECFKSDSIKNGFENAEEAYDEIKLPVRKTKGSAGYDIRTPYTIEMYGGDRIVVPTGIKAKMDEGEVLLLVVRSSVGIKHGIVFSNGTGVIDSDYYSNDDNDGDIMLALWNSSSKLVKYEAGDRIAQGIFVNHGIVEDDDADGIRTGGIGSTRI